MLEYINHFYPFGYIDNKYPWYEFFDFPGQLYVTWESIIGADDVEFDLIVIFSIEREQACYL